MSVETGLLAVMFLLLANAFFVGAEFSLVSVRRSAIEPDAANGSKRAIATLRALENISFLMAGAQLGITLCSLALGAVAEPAIAHMLEVPLHELGIADELLHPIAFALALTITVFLHVVIGEMVPKNIALASPERSALFLTPKLVFVVRILNPVVKLLNMLANGILRLFGVKPKNEVSSTYNRDEMAALLKESRREGYLSEDNEELLSGALAFDTRTVKNIAIPMDDLVSVDRNITYADLEELASKTGFSRFPVVGDKNKILGYVHIKDVIRHENTDRADKISLRDVRKMAEVSANQSIRMTLKIMQRGGVHMAVVYEGKEKVGLITLEDVLEELIGEMSEQAAKTK